MCIRDSPVAFGVGDYGIYQFQNVLFAADIRKGVIAVSYTHLDVYKRQVDSNAVPHLVLHNEPT